MPLPTLLQKGRLVSIDSDKQNELDDIIPIDYIIDWFKKRLNTYGIENRVLILKSDTASGKTTLLPPYLYDNFYSKSKKTIAVTQPRVITAINNAKEIAKIPAYKSMIFGKTIGYQTGPSKRKIKTGVLFMTIGSLTLQFKLLTDEELIKKYSFIIFDEVHEMSIELAQALFSLKKFLIRNKNNPNLPFIICTSATMDPDKFIEYFGLSRLINYIQVQGFAYPKITHWLKDPSENYIKSSIDTIKDIHIKNLSDDSDKSDILLFMPSMKEMIEIEKELQKYNEDLALRDSKVIDILKIDSSAVANNTSDYIKTFIPANKLKIQIQNKILTPFRKIIMSTSIAETGLTIDTLKYVIDSGYHRGTEFYSIVGATALLNKPVDIYRVEQRKGRVGRKFPGEFYPLYTESIYKKLLPYQFSDLILNDTTSVILNSMVIEGDDFNINNLDLIDRLPSDNVHYSIEKCYLLGFCNSQGKITELGKLANKFTMYRPEVARMILSAYFWGCNIFDIISIATYVQMSASDFQHKNPIDWVYIYKNSFPSFLLGGPSDRIIFKTKMLICDDFINGLFLFTAIGNIIRKSNKDNFYNDLVEFSETINIKFESLINFINVRDNLIETMLNIGLNVMTNNKSIIDIEEDKFINEIIKIKYCIYEGFRNNIAIYNKETYKYEITAGSIKIPSMFSDKELTRAKNEKYGIDYKTLPKYILYDRLMLKYNTSSKMYDIKAERISSLDGFVNIDLNFT